MHRFFKLFVLIISTCFCFSCATLKEPTVKAYRQVLVLLHIKSPSDFEIEAGPQVCVLDPAGMIPKHSAGPPSDSKEAPSLEIKEMTYDFGVLKEEGDYVHHFKLKNVGSAVLSIKKVVPG